MHTPFHFSCHETRCGLSLSRYRGEVVTLLVYYSGSGGCRPSYPPWVHSSLPVTIRFRFCLKRLVTCWTVNMKQKLVYFNSYLSILLTSTLPHPCSLWGSGQLSSLGTVTWVHVIDTQCLSLRRRSRKEVSIALDTLGAGGLLGLASFFLQTWSEERWPFGGGCGSKRPL